MEILILIIAVIVVYYRKHKDTLFKSIRKTALKIIALALSIIVVISVLVTEFAERLLNEISKEERL